MDITVSPTVKCVENLLRTSGPEVIRLQIEIDILNLSPFFGDRSASFVLSRKSSKSFACDFDGRSLGSSSLCADGMILIIVSLKAVGVP